MTFWSPCRMLPVSSAPEYCLALARHGASILVRGSSSPVYRRTMTVCCNARRYIALMSLAVCIGLLHNPEIPQQRFHLLADHGGGVLRDDVIRGRDPIHGFHADEQVPGATAGQLPSAQGDCAL